MLTMRSSSNKEELVLSNRKIMYQGNIYIMLEEYEMLDKEQTENCIKKEQSKDQVETTA